MSINRIDEIDVLLAAYRCGRVGRNITHINTLKRERQALIDAEAAPCPYINLPKVAPNGSMYHPPIATRQ